MSFASFCDVTGCAGFSAGVTDGSSRTGALEHADSALISAVRQAFPKIPFKPKLLPFVITVHRRLLNPRKSTSEYRAPSEQRIGGSREKLKSRLEQQVQWSATARS